MACGKWPVAVASGLWHEKKSFVVMLFLFFKKKDEIKNMNFLACKEWLVLVLC